jgi:hypothetical protein
MSYSAWFRSERVWRLATAVFWFVSCSSSVCSPTSLLLTVGATYGRHVISMIGLVTLYQFRLASPQYYFSFQFLWDLCALKVLCFVSHLR